MVKKSEIRLDGFMGTWYVVDSSYYNGEQVHLLESEIFGDESAGVIVNNNLQIIATNVWNGFSDLDD